MSMLLLALTLLKISESECIDFMAMNIEKLKLSLKNGTFFPVVIHALRNVGPCGGFGVRLFEKCNLKIGPTEY